MEIRDEQKTFFNVGINYKKADTKVRGKFSLSHEKKIALLEEAKKMGMGGVLVLSTCNRTEISGFVACPFRLIQLLCKHSNGNIDEFNKVSNIYQGDEAVNHLFRIGTGLESQILGDYEIVGQLRIAYKLAREVGVANAYIERLINSIMQASKRVKNETMLSSGTTSVSYAGVQYLTDHYKNYNQKNILVFGLGKMGKHTCLNLAKYTNNQKVTLINRTEDKVDDFIKNIPTITKGDYNNLTNEIAKNDVLIVSTGADKHTITTNQIPKDKEILILDMSMPANVAPDVNELPNTTVINVDELSKVTDKTLAKRKAEIPKAEAIINEHKEEFYEWRHHRKLIPAVSSLKQSLEKIQENEINFQRKKVRDFDEEQAHAISSRIIQKITTQFVKHLKSNSTDVNQSIEVMNKVFEDVLETSNGKN